MHYYLFDERATKGMTEQELAKLTSCIKTSQVAGQQITLRSPQQLIEESKSIANSKKNPTIVVVGDDLSLDLVIGGVQSATKSVVVGFIPTSSGSLSAQLLKLKSWRHAISELPKRKTGSFNFLKVNKHYALSVCSVEPDTKKQGDLEDIEIDLDSQLKLAAPPCTLVITNLSGEEEYDDSPSNFKLEAYLVNDIGGQIENKNPIINVSNFGRKQKRPLVIRLKANQADLKIQNTYLISGILPISKDVMISKSTSKQDIIMSRDSDPLSRS